MQVMLGKEVAESSGFSLKLAVPTGTSLLVEGMLLKTPEGTEQVQPLRLTPHRSSDPHKGV